MNNWDCFRRLTAVAGLSLLVLGACSSAVAQKTGDSARVTVGIVEAKQPVDLKSNTGRNALIGGALGWGLARNKSSKTQAAAALGGAALGGGGTSAAQGANTAMQYTIRTSAGSAIQVITGIEIIDLARDTARQVRSIETIQWTDSGDTVSKRRSWN